MATFPQKNHIKSIRNFLFGIGLLFLVILVAHSWDKLLQLLPNIHWFLFILSVLIGFLGNLFASLFFKELLHKYDVEVTNQLAHKIFFYAQMAKYIPGKIWVLFYQAMLVNKTGATRAMLFANIDLTAISILISAAVSISLMSFNYSIIFSGFCFITGLFISILIAKSCYLFASINYIFSYIKHLKNQFGTCDTKIKIFKIVIYYTFFWSTYLISAFLMMFAVFNFSMVQSANYIAYLGIAWIVGVLSFFIPGGMGVRELVFVILANSVSNEVSLEMLSSIAVISRFWIILQELTGISLILIWDFYKTMSFREN
ncbi:MAG: flippase-like domain-containing protein [Candidatus Marithrix sp.]|nr:flippase-like domain-containing protein [Candidatus Marithrix sp.]